MARHRAEDPKPAAPPLRLIVTGSPDWPNSGAVAEAMLRAWLDAGQPLDVTIITTGRETGAEQMARTVAGSRGWKVVDGGFNLSRRVLTLTFETQTWGDDEPYPIVAYSMTSNGYQGWVRRRSEESDVRAD